MIIFVGKSVNKLKSLKESVHNAGLACREQDWEKVIPHQKAVYILTSLPANGTAPKMIAAILENGSTVFSVCKEEEQTRIENPGVLKLPADIPDPILYNMVFWVSTQKSQSLCYNIFHSIFSGDDFHFLFIKEDGVIICSVPEKESVLGFSNRNLSGKSFMEMFAFDIGTLINNPEEGRDNYSLKGSNGELIPVYLLVTPIEKNFIPSIPGEARFLVFISQLKQIKSIGEQTSKLSVIQDNLLKLKTQELESTNRILQKQTDELKGALKKLDNRSREIIEEIKLASELQKSLVPKALPANLPLDLAYKYLPYAYIGGDFFDVIRLDQNKIGIFISDVSGHGVSAAFITAMVKSSLTHYAGLNRSPAETLTLLNKEFVKAIQTDHYITAFYAILDLDLMQCVYCNAGHPKQLLMRARGEVAELTSMGFFIGMFEKTEYEDNRINLEPGDRLFFFTDGVLEITDTGGDMFGRSNLIRLAKQYWHEDINRLSNTLLSELVMFMKDNTFPDDITLIITEVLELI